MCQETKLKQLELKVHNMGIKIQCLESNERHFRASLENHSERIAVVSNLLEYHVKKSNLHLNNL